MPRNSKSSGPEFPLALCEELMSQSAEADDRKFEKHFTNRATSRKEKRKLERLGKKRKHFPLAKPSETNSQNPRLKKHRIFVKDKNVTVNNGSNATQSANAVVHSKEKTMKSTLQDEIDQNDQEMRWLERKLHIKPGRTPSNKAFQGDGLDELLKGITTGSRKPQTIRKGTNDNDYPCEIESAEILPDRLADGGAKQVAEDNQQQFYNTNDSSGKYIPPHVRTQMVEAEEGQLVQLVRLKQQLRGLLNRLSESNVENIVMGIDELYYNHPRHDVTSAVSTLIIEIVSSKSSLPDQFVIMYATLVAALYKIHGIDFCTHILQLLVKEFNSYYEQCIGNAIELHDYNKECMNMVELLAQLYNLKVISCVLIFDLVHLFMQDLNELNVELLLKMITSSGNHLRQDDPSALKEIIHHFHLQMMDKISETMGSRMKFMVQMIINLKNNCFKHSQSSASLETFDKMKKFLANIGKKIHAKGTEPLQVTFKDIMSDDWRVGSHQASSKIFGKPLPHTSVTLGHVIDRKSSVPEALLRLASQQKMNTDVRKAVFVILMTSKDYIEAFEHILKLNLKDTQQREVPRVILHCCSNEKVYNPYYSLLAAHLCSYNHSHKITLQYGLWDFLRECGEQNIGGLTLLKSGIHRQYKEMPLRQLTNMAKFYAAIIACGHLSIVILKTVSFMNLCPQAHIFFKLLFTELILLTQSEHHQQSNDGNLLSKLACASISDNSNRNHSNNSAVLIETFDKATSNQSLAHGIIFFLEHYICDYDVVKNESEQMLVKLGCNIVKEVLKSSIGNAT